MRRLPLFLFIAVCFLAVSLGMAWWQVFQTKQAIETKLKQNQELIYRNAALQADIQDLKTGTDAVQERARLQLGMIKKDEVFVQVMDQPSVVQAAPSPPANPTEQSTPNSANSPNQNPVKP